MWPNTQKPKPHPCECHCLADSQLMVRQLSNNTGTKSPGGLAAGLVACKAGSSSTEWVRGLERPRL